MRIIQSIVLILIFLFAKTSKAQDLHVIDSLLKVVQSTASDSIKTDTFVALATAHSNSDSALLYAYKAHALGKQINYTKGMIWGLFKAGDEYIVLTDFNKADSIYHIVLKTSTRLEFKEGIGLGHFGIGKVLFYTGQRTESVKKLETAVDHLKEAKSGYIYGLALRMLAENYATTGEYQKALTTLEKLEVQMKEHGGVRDLSMTYNMYGLVSNELGNYARGLQYLYRAIDLERKAFGQPKCVLVNNLGDTHYQLGEYRIALRCFKEAIDLDREQNTSDITLTALLNIGLTYQKLNLNDSALFYHQIALEMVHNGFDDKVWVARVYNDLGFSYTNLNQFDSSFYYLNKAVTMMTELGDRMALCEAYINLGETYLKIKDYPKASKNAEKIISLAKELQYPSGVRDGSLILAEAQFAMGNSTAAYRNHRLHKQMYDSLINEQQTRKISKLEAEFEFQQELDSIAFEQEKTALTYETEIQKKNIINRAAIGGGILSIIILIILYRSNLTKKRKNQQLSEKNVEISNLREKEKKLADETIALKERELTTITMLSHERNSLLQQLGNQIGGLSDKVDEEVIPDLKEIKKTIKANLSDESWSAFVYHFEKVHPKLFDELQVRFPSLTQNDLRLCAYIRVGMDRKEMATVANVTPEAIKKSLYRLKKKMDLDAETDIREFLIGL